MHEINVFKVDYIEENGDCIIEKLIDQ